MYCTGTGMFITILFTTLNQKITGSSLTKNEKKRQENGALYKISDFAILINDDLYSAAQVYYMAAFDTTERDDTNFLYLII